MDLRNKKVVVVGLKRTGVSLSEFLVQRGAAVVATDLSDGRDIGLFLDKIRRPGVSLELGKHRISTFETADLVILSPGVPHNIPAVEAARAKYVPVMGELELASRFIETPIVAVTGTNGKTTTTELLGSMFRCSGKSVFVGGNIGNPLIEYVNQKTPVDIVVAELSSFQLDTAWSFRPDVGVVLNITDDHLDRYDDFNAYAASKMKLFTNQTAADTAVLNAADPVVHPFLNTIRSRILHFDAVCAKEPGAVIQKGHIDYRLPGLPVQRVSVNGSSLIGSHNVQNIAAAGLAALAAGCTVEGIAEAVTRFKGLPHRMEFVKTLNGVHFYNDSKATNVDAVVKALESFAPSVLLIMGGRDKGGNFNLLKEAVHRRVKQLIVLGETKSAISDALGKETFTIAAADMDEAVAKAFETAAAGDTVLLSPGCASFDMFDGYAHRGDTFKKAVEKLESKR
ncbi:MAG: UDP-N-acetylmuramoyl-L-alanine--D-glutamate ligase [Desulfobacterales bacterium]